VVRVIDVFIDRLDSSGLGFKAEAAETGRPDYHPRTMLKIYVYGFLNRVHSSRRLEREAKRNVDFSIFLDKSRGRWWTRFG
jgi:transposase